MQREGTAHPRLPLGEAEAQELEEGPQGTPFRTQTLHLADFLLKYGPSSLVAALKENIYDFRNFDSYSLVADGVDRGESIRKQSRVVVSLLSDDHFLNDERARAKQIKDRMANVIGSGAYYGNFSNDGSSLPTTGTARKDTYESFSASSYRPGFGSGGSTGMTFGESVMRSLQQAKKEERVDPPPSEEKPAGKLNLAKMNIAKPEEKKNFNSLSMKLVKPPEKKAVEKKEQPVVPAQKQQPKPQQRPAGKVDIMDFDFLGSVPEPNQEQTVDNSSKSNTFDFLGAPTTTNPPVSQSQTSFNVLKFAPTVPNGQINSPVPYQGIAHQPTAPQNFFYGGSPVPAFNFVPAAQSVPPNFIPPQSSPPVPAVSISLSAPPQVILPHSAKDQCFIVAGPDRLLELPRVVVAFGAAAGYSFCHLE
jgi:hypothetical protein